MHIFFFESSKMHIKTCFNFEVFQIFYRCQKLKRTVVPKFILQDIMSMATVETSTELC